MRKICKLFLVLVLLTVSIYESSAQSKNPTYLKVDQKAAKASAEISSNIDSLVHFLTADYSSGTEKVRAIFVWVANNISYDIKKFDERKKLIGGIVSKRDISQQAENVLLSRLAVCEGYSNLITAMCSKAGVESYVVDGLARPSVKKPTELHGWNAIKINGEWKLLDATWSAGGIDFQKKIFTNHFTDDYFFPEPASFIKTHYAFDPMWHLLSQPVKRKDFDREDFFPDDAITFNFNDSIIYYFQSDSISQLISYCRRTLEYDPFNHLAEQNLENLMNYKASEKMNRANEQCQEGVKLFNQYVEFINEAKRTRNTKKMNAEETKLRQLLRNSRAGIEKGMEIYKTLKFSDGANVVIIRQNIEIANENLKMIKEQEKYLENYFSKPKMMRIYAL